jgi:hypothetical protein
VTNLGPVQWVQVHRNSLAAVFIDEMSTFPKSGGMGGISAAAPAHGSFTWLVLPFQLGYQLVCVGQKIVGARLSHVGRMTLPTLDKQFHQMRRRFSGHRPFPAQKARA